MSVAAEFFNCTLPLTIIGTYHLNLRDYASFSDAILLWSVASLSTRPRLAYFRKLKQIKIYQIPFMMTMKPIMHLVRSGFFGFVIYFDFMRR